jgi:hypothetical protein
MKTPLFRLVLVVVLASPALWPGSTSPATATLVVRTTEELAPCIERVVADLRPGVGVRVEVGDPTSTEGADVVIGAGPRLTRVLESGRADDRWTARLGFHGRHVTATSVVAAPVGRSDVYEDARRLVVMLDTPAAHRAFLQCSGVRTASRDAYGVEEAAAPFVAGAERYAARVVDSWMPGCSLQRNSYSDPNEVLGAPNALNTAPRGEPTRYRGMISLGQGGFAVLDMGQAIANRSGNDVRVYQFTGEEPVSLYGADTTTESFKLIGFRRYCGNRIPGAPANWGYCDFDLSEGGLSSARYLRVEDGELYPCLRGDTDSEGADIDAVELLNQ